jgi:hypothetical protein
MIDGVVFIDDGKSCEPITVPMCKDIGYTMTQFPNSLGHTSQVVDHYLSFCPFSFGHCVVSPSSIYEI